MLTRCITGVATTTVWLWKSIRARRRAASAPSCPPSGSAGSDTAGGASGSSTNRRQPSLVVNFSAAPVPASSAAELVAAARVWAPDELLIAVTNLSPPRPGR